MGQGEGFPRGAVEDTRCFAGVGRRMGPTRPWGSVSGWWRVGSLTPWSRHVPPACGVQHGACFVGLLWRTLRGARGNLARAGSGQWRRTQPLTLRCSRGGVKRGSRNHLEGTLPLPRKAELQPTESLAVVGRLQETRAHRSRIHDAGRMWSMESKKGQRGGKEPDV